VVYAITHQRDRKAGTKFFDVARERFGDEAADGPPAVWNVMKVFALVSVFWALFDQHASSWVRQAAMMDLEVDFPIFGHVKLLASQTQAFNPMFVMLIIPGLNFIVYPLIEKTGLKLTPLRKMASGMFLASLAFVFVALLQNQVDSEDQKVSALWQVVPYLTMTTAEVLVSAVGLEFAYTQAPRSMKSTIMGFWLLTVTMGNVLVGLFAKYFQHLELVDFFWTFACMMAVAALGFTILSAFYKGRSFLQGAGVAS
jgi:POT family proton-dependent oligopeptide transporter